MAREGPAWGKLDYSCFPHFLSLIRQVTPCGCPIQTAHLALSLWFMPHSLGQILQASSRLYASLTRSFSSPERRGFR
jgi:hypothetical protein